ncbi:MAG: TonB-dependent receptor domain-containing protein, partial [Gammaproteobacteria bacterium]
LLDEDLAARGAALGRIYNDLGFQQLALVEGWKSVNTDPSNYSAHRLLADNYAALPRHEIARVSELLQSQLLQPININNLQPQLAERGLQILEGAGPSDLSFNEFNPLFTRDRLSLQANALIGTNDTYADDAVISGIAGRLSYSLGQFHFESDGFRDNNDLQHDIYNAFVQTAISPRLDVQAEYRRRETDQGDLELRFDPNNFSRDRRREIEQDIVRLGAHYSPTPRSHAIVSGFYTDRETGVNEPSGRPALRVEDTIKGYQGEIQYVFRHPIFSATVGGGIYDLDFDTRTRLDFFRPCPLPTCELIQDLDPQHHNFYAYLNLGPSNRITGTLGIAYDFFEQRDFDLEAVNPKLGVQWDITDWARLRLAYFETVKRALAVDQTVEPTQIAGFNQFFDDANGTEAERWGAGLDASFTNTLHGGVEYSRR